MYKAASSSEGRKKERNAWPQITAGIFSGFSNGMAKTIKFSSIELMICPLKWQLNQSSPLLNSQVIKNIHEAALDYQAWKAEHAPSYKPWIWPEQSILPKLRRDDVESVSSESPSGSDQEEEMVGDPANSSSEDNLDENIML